MYLNTKYIDVFKYFLNTFVNTFLYYFQNIRFLKRHETSRPGRGSLTIKLELLTIK